MSGVSISGRKGEELAARFLTGQKGYTILSRNYRSRYGELDIVAQDGEWIVFVEVKARKNDLFATASASVTPAKQDRLRKTALLWLAHHNCEAPARFDVIELYADGRINHITYAFR